MFTYTIVCYGSEIACGTGNTFESAQADAKEQLGPSDWYPQIEFGYICVSPSGMTIRYNV